MRSHRRVLAVGFSFGMGALAAAFATAAAGGCGAMSADESGSAEGAAGSPDGGAHADSSAIEADVVGEKSSADRENLTVAIIHASANLWPFRVCLKDAKGGFVSTEPLPSDPGAVMPHSNIVGVAPGSALLLRNAQESLGFGPVTIEPFFIPVDRIEGNAHHTCAELICEGDNWCLKAGNFASFPSTTIVPTSGDSAFVMAVHGCLAGEGTVTAERCGGEVQGPGKLALQVFETISFDSSEPNAGTARVRVAHLSPSAGALLLPDAGGQQLQLRYGDLADPMSGKDLLGAGGFLTIQPPVGSDDISIPGTAASQLPMYEQKGFTLLATLPDGGTSRPLSLSLAAVQDLSDTAAVPPAFWNDSTDFLVALVGDATKDAAQLQFLDGGDNPFFDGVGLHVIALPLRLRASQDAGSSD